MHKVPQTQEEIDYITAAASIGQLAELCTYTEYDPVYGAVVPYWRPLYMDFVALLTETMKILTSNK